MRLAQAVFPEEDFGKVLGHARQASTLAAKLKKRHAADINAPVLLIHGTIDNTVRIAHSQKMYAALQAAGKQSELLTLDGLDHQLDDSDARTAMLVKIGEFLDRTIGR